MDRGVVQCQSIKSKSRITSKTTADASPSCQCGIKCWGGESGRGLTHSTNAATFGVQWPSTAFGKGNCKDDRSPKVDNSERRLLAIQVRIFPFPHRVNVAKLSHSHTNGLKLPADEGAYVGAFAVAQHNTK